MPVLLAQQPFKIRKDGSVARRRASIVPRQPKVVSDILAEMGLKDTPFDNAPYRNTTGAPEVVWKLGAQLLPLSPAMELYDLLTPEELSTCAILRILPKVYFDIKKTMLQAVRHHGPFKKREAQTWFRIDVNKICIIYDWFKDLGWIPNTAEWSPPGMGSGAAAAAAAAAAASVPTPAPVAGVKRRPPPPSVSTAGIHAHHAGPYSAQPSRPPSLIISSSSASSRGSPESAISSPSASPPPLSAPVSTKRPRFL
ncbi:hypothetical protein HK105_205186 [Polyrhizophydium stewartii]|uniref:SWIRM domain-containing protein n=1 Tax=Polyrhizophydium stewartii TaxID=2732419 RepID=A0ABR4N721_9FUNG